MVLIKFFILLSLYVGGANNHSFQEPLTGKWVDVDHPTDTLTFLVVGGVNYFNLRRGMEMRNGVSRPKIGSGPYRYKLPGTEVISLNWSLSSDSAYNDYYFKQSENTLTIGKFFDVSTPGVMLTFNRIN